MGSSSFSGVAILDGIAYITQRGNVSIDPILAVDAATGALLYSFGSEDTAQDQEPTWGAHGIGVSTNTGYNSLGKGECCGGTRKWG